MYASAHLCFEGDESVYSQDSERQTVRWASDLT